MRVIDCFPYFNEKELLELRINLLYDYVDKFIICDADRTHRGKPKPFTCRDILKDLGLLSDKIQIVEVNLPSNKEVSDNWVRERTQRNFAQKFISDDDVCIISDCDEIINPKFIKYYTDIAQKHPQHILRIPLAFLIGRADLRAFNESGNPVSWNSPFVCLKSHLEKYTLSDIRESHALNIHNLKHSDIFITQENVIEEAGWHFSWMGGVDGERIKEKSKIFLHDDEFLPLENYLPKENSTDPLGRSDHILKKYPKELLPSKIFELDRVHNFLLPKYD